MSEDMKQLIKLQEADTLIADLKNRIENLEKESKLKEDEILTLQASLQEQNTKNKQYEVDLNQIKGEIDSANETMEKYADQKKYIKKPRELFALNREIENTIKTLKTAEEQQKKTQAEFDNFKQEYERNTSILNEKREELELIRGKNCELIEKNKQEIKTTKITREKLTETIPAELLDTYKFITGKKMGTALSQVIDESCGQCFLAVPPQLVNEIRKGEQIIRCPSCARILYLKD